MAFAEDPASGLARAGGSTPLPLGPGPASPYLATFLVVFGHQVVPWSNYLVRWLLR